MVVNGQPFFLGLLAFLATQLSPLLAGCPLDLSSSNFTLVASICSVQSDRGKCCRYINAFIAISIARYANSTTNLGVTGDLSSICLNSISQTMQLYGVPRNAMGFCGLGTKVPVNYNCKGRTTTVQMLRSPKFSKVARNCEIPFSGENSCSKCLNSGIAYVRSLVGEESNVTLSTCRDAAYAAIASRFDSASSLELASCFFQVPELHNNTRDLMSSPSPATPLGSPRPSYSTSPSANVYGDHEPKLHPSFHLTAIHAVGIAITAVALTMLMVLVVLIHRKSRELEDSENMDKNSSKTFPSPRPVLKFHEGNSPAFRKFSYKETKKATKNFSIEIGCGGFGTVYRAEFSDGAMAAVKRMNKISKQGEEEFCREIELLARLHHRHLVALKGFCVKKNER